MSKICSSVVALDGAYFLFPGAIDRPKSHPEQAETIIRTAEALGMAATVMVPNEPWESEVVKRAALFGVAGALAKPDDWMLWLDADEVLTGVGNPAQLDQPLDVAEVVIWDQDYGGRCMIRRLFRALPDITVEFAHWLVTATKDGRRVVLSGYPKLVKDLEPAFTWSDIRIEHRTRERDPERRERKRRYYDLALPRERLAVGDSDLASETAQEYLRDIDPNLVAT
jgi:hypothetical protein